MDTNQSNPNASWWAAPNQFTDLSLAEFSQRHLGIDPAQARLADHVEEVKPPASRRRLSQGWPPTVTDWVAAGGTTPIKNQGSVSWPACLLACGCLHA